MIPFETTGGDVVFLNPLYVRSVFASKDYKGNPGTTIRFSDDDYWLVKGSPEEVVAHMTSNFGFACMEGPR